jgi:hypothetical protein
MAAQPEVLVLVAAFREPLADEPDRQCVVPPHGEVATVEVEEQPVRLSLPALTHALVLPSVETNRRVTGRAPRREVDRRVSHQNEVLVRRLSVAVTGGQPGRAVNIVLQEQQKVAGRRQSSSLSRPGRTSSPESDCPQAWELPCHRPQELGRAVRAAIVRDDDLMDFGVLEKRCERSWQQSTAVARRKNH